MVKFVTRAGDDGIYTHHGDKVGIILDTVLADDLIDALNVDEDTVTTPDQQELLDALEVHKIETVEELDYYVKAKNLQEQNEERLDEIYDILSLELVKDGISESQIDALNTVIETLKSLGKLTDNLSEKEKKKLEENTLMKKAANEATKVNNSVKKYLQKCIERLESTNAELKKLLEEKP